MRKHSMRREAREILKRLTDEEAFIYIWGGLCENDPGKLVDEVIRQYQIKSCRAVKAGRFLRHIYLCGEIYRKMEE